MTSNLKTQYEQFGYAVAPGVIPTSEIDALLKMYKESIVPSKTPFYRQNTSQYERNQLTEHGYVKQSFLDIHAYQTFKDFSRQSMQIYSHPQMRKVLSEVTGNKTHHLMQTMLFDANTTTPAHQDWWYLDSVPNGHLLGAWIALEDIDEKAGRFYVIPGSHKVDLHSDTPGLPHSQWLERIKKYRDEHQQEIHAPALKKGDVLFWNSRTIHGSLPTIDPSLSRKSLTAHYLPDGLAFGNLFVKKDWVKYYEHEGMRYFRNQPDYSISRQALARFKRKAYDFPMLMKISRVIQKGIMKL